MKHGKIVVFGAGKIGRSFIGQLFGTSGYEVVFVDTDSQLVENLNRYGRYKVIARSDEGDSAILIGNVRGIHADDKETVIEELSAAEISAVSVGQTGLPHVAPLIAQALILRREKSGDRPLDIILAENMRNAGRFMAEQLISHLSHDYPLDKLVGLVETSIGKMAPFDTGTGAGGQHGEASLLVVAEPYNSLIVDRSAFLNPVPAISGLEPKENIRAWVDRKLFIHNLGHSSAAYLGYQEFPDAVYLYEVLDDGKLLNTVRSTMLQSAAILMALHPGEFSSGELTGHIDDLLHRFRNRALRDTLFRAGCDLFRKLGPDDRLIAPLKAAIKLGKEHDLILNAVIAAVSFRAKDLDGRYHPDDTRFFAEAAKGTFHIMKTVCGLQRPRRILMTGIKSCRLRY
ncbi:MAG: mannitol-1-phosphate 5-dehydrogenase [Marinilabiliales bacterium]|nr:MAG: mannitol-1-phosphate 5-dehydrogenase [Marinilabiliales bacterium]